MLTKKFLSYLDGGILDIGMKSSMHTKAVQDCRSRLLEVLCPSRLTDITERVAQFRLAEVGGKWEVPSRDRKNWRRRKPDGSYEYRDTPPEEQSTQEPEPQLEKVKQLKPVLKHHRKLKKDELKNVLDKGHVTFISAGRNGKDPKEEAMSPDDPLFHERHEKLRSDLEHFGYDYTEVVGVYGGKEKTFLVFHDDTELSPKTAKSVMVHHKDADELRQREKSLTELGKKYNQNSVLHRTDGKNRMHFTTGKNEGVECGKEGWNEAPEATDYYTDIELAGHEHTKFQLDVEDCIQKGLLARLTRISMRIVPVVERNIV
jgi:hypothetical protein